ncbi:hypothetical protein D9611_005772 [Ephemerocybe angulata]|uniref:LCCL domain-containing protein n=1 Tax=Ephemerocybe angulata TaxID=980116 RepID=A0A8H5F4G2_9AGAR|nr:hypothetical protein D9611_005772 [Tulosesus angulatus]
MPANSSQASSSSLPDNQSKDSALPTYVIQGDTKAANAYSVHSGESYDLRSSQDKSNDSLQNLSPSTSHPSRAQQWLQGRINRVSTTNPRLYSRVSTILLWLRGPRPRVELPAPKPLLDIDINSRGHKVSIPIERTMIKATRFLTAPWVLIILGIGYIIALAFLSRARSFLVPAESVITCTSTFLRANNQCGLNGQDCIPMNRSQVFDFKCPAQCANVILQNPRTVGNEQIAFKPLLVGGGDSERTYRGDSFVCAAAQQAGIISGSEGGCGQLQLLPDFTDFLPTTANGLTSIGFPTIFPLAFRFSPNTSLKHCSDNRNGVLAFDILVTCLLFLVLRPKAIVLYWCLVCIGFWHVSLFSQPNNDPPAIDEIFGRFLPTLFVAYAFWRSAIRFTMPKIIAKAPLESCVLYLSGFWVGVLNNLTFDRLPLSRLTSSDIGKRAGGVVTLVVLIVVVAVCAINQVLVIRKTGWLPYYVGWYLVGGLVIMVLALLPGLSLRLHHYIIPIILLPGTAFPTKLSAIYQGLLLGLFLNGVAAFGFDPIVQSAAALRQDATLGSLLPTFLTNSTTWDASSPLANQTLKWAPLPQDAESLWSGFALLVDDIERYAGTGLEFALGGLNASIPHFFRLAFMSDSQTGDFTKAATLWPNGTWVDPLPGGSY